MTSVSNRIAAASFVFLTVAVFAGCEDKNVVGGPASASAAKSGAAAGGKVASCSNVKVESVCREYGPKNVEAAGEDFLKKMCEGLGEFKTEACPKDKRLGTCATQEGTKVYYTEGGMPMDAAGAEKACKEGVPAGEWKAGG